LLHFGLREDKAEFLKQADQLPGQERRRIDADVEQARDVRGESELVPDDQIQRLQGAY
jgi:hypothetical protein